MRSLLFFPLLLLAGGPWQNLFDGQSLRGWILEGDANFRVENGAIVVDKGAYSWLRSETAYTDYELTLEFKTAADGNSGVFLRSAATGRPHETGYELQIFDAHKEFPTGGIVGHAKGAPGIRLRPEQWNRYEIRHQGNRLLVKLNGKPTLDWRDDKAKSGYVGLQFNPAKPIAFRKIRLREL